MRRRGNMPELVAAAAAGQTLKEIAAAGGVSISTAQRRMTDPMIRAQIEQALAYQRLEALATFARLRSAATERLRDLIDDQDPSIALRAVTLVLSESARLDATQQLHDKVTTLQAMVTALETGEVYGDRR